MSRTSHPKIVGRNPPQETPMFFRALCKTLTGAYAQKEAPARRRGAAAGSAAYASAKRLDKLGEPGPEDP